MLIKTLPVGQLETNCYIIVDEITRRCAIVDPGAESNTIMDYIESNNLIPHAILLTHGHFDHRMALDPILEEVTDVYAYIHELEIASEFDDPHYKLQDNGEMTFYAEGDVIKVGTLEIFVMETPGHTAGSVTLRCEKVLFTGDTLFRDSCGRTDLNGSMEDMLLSLKRLSDLKGDYEVYPGHAESSTLDRERAFNYYMKQALSNNPGMSF